MIPTKPGFVGVLPTTLENPMNLPYPMELHSVEPGFLLIDYAICQLAAAGIEEAYVVCNQSNIGPLATALGYLRFGVALKFVERSAKDLPTFAATILRGCRRANYSGDYTKFVVIPPVTKFDYPEVIKDLIKQPVPCFATFQTGTLEADNLLYGTGGLIGRLMRNDEAATYTGFWGAFTIDMDCVLRLRKILRATPVRDTGEVRTFSNLIQMDIVNNSAGYYLALEPVDNVYYNLSDWGNTRHYMFRAAERVLKASCNEFCRDLMYCVGCTEERLND